MRLVADDPVFAEALLDQIFPRWKFRPIRIGSKAGLRVSDLIHPAHPNNPKPLVDGSLGGRTCVHPSLVVLLAFAGEFDGPQARRAITIDHANQRAAPCLLDKSPHRRRDDESLFVNHALRLVDVDVGTATVFRTRMSPEEGLRFIYRDTVVGRRNDTVAELGIDPKRFEIAGVRDRL